MTNTTTLPRHTSGHVSYFIAARRDSAIGCTPDNWRAYKAFDIHADALATARKRRASIGWFQDVYGVDDSRELWLIFSYE